MLRRRVLLRNIIVFVLLGQISLLITSLFPSNNVETKQGLRVAIATLIRSTNHSIELTINMIHSMTKFYPFDEQIDYSMIIFHEEDFSSSMRERILSCAGKRNRHLKIYFVALEFKTKATPSPNSRPTKPTGYRLMCQFWSHDIYFHPAILDRNFDYLMRMDDDSYFNEKIESDLFKYVFNKTLDYAYRSIYHEGFPDMIPIFEQFSSRDIESADCIYNNFFIIRLNWIYQSEDVQKFLKELIKDDLMIREYIGDGCVHQAMLFISDSTKYEHMTHFSYGHNYHIMAKGREMWGFYPLTEIQNFLVDSCQTLSIIEPNSFKIERISEF